jgi:hypothetical protein
VGAGCARRQAFCRRARDQRPTRSSVVVPATIPVATIDASPEN